ncbi:MAG: DNA recombination protein RmuC [Paracoccaceae bacterium]
MITFGDIEIDASDPVLIGIGAVGLLLLILLLAVIRLARRNREAVEPLMVQIGRLGENLQTLSQGQQQLQGGLNTVAQSQLSTQAKMIQSLEARITDMQKGMSDTLSAGTQRTTKTLAELQERLATIDKAQTNIEKLSGDVLSLQDILSNKQTRGAFGEIQLNDIVGKALPSDSYTLQATLSNGKRADCLIHLPNPPGPIVIDSKFPLEAYDRLVAAGTKAEITVAARDFRTSVRGHIKNIAARYIIEGETADGAILFLPSEAVYAELHAKFSDVVREGFAARVWIVSPTTCMATLNTMRAILKDARMREQAGAIRKELGLLHKDVERLGERVGNLDRHFTRAAKDISEIKISAEKAGNRARRLDAFDFEDTEPEIASADVVRLDKDAG